MTGIAEGQRSNDRFRKMQSQRIANINWWWRASTLATNIDCHIAISPEINLGSG